MAPTSDHLQQQAFWVVVAATTSAGLSFLVDLAPTGIDNWNRILAATFAVCGTLLLAFAPKWLQLPTLGIAIVFGGSLAIVVAAAAALVIVLALDLARRPSPVTNAAIGAVATHGLLRLETTWWFGLESAIAGLIMLVALVGTLRSLEGTMRVRVQRGVSIALLLGLGVSAVGAVGAWRASSDVTEGSRSARLGLDAARDGDVETASVRLASSTRSLERAETKLTAFWMAPARLVPVVGQHLDAATAATTNARAVSSSAHNALLLTDVDALRLSNGAVDLELIGSMAAPLQELEDALTLAIEGLNDARSPWLVPPVQRQLDDAVEEVGQALPDATKAAEATRLLPGLLGADEPRRYLVLFATPAESRELGGMIANVVELTADDGRISITRRLRAHDLNEQGPGTLQDSESYPARFILNNPELFIQNWTGMTDFPAVTKAIADLYPTMGGDPIDGVLYADPYGVAALMELTGPVTVPELDRSLDANTLPEFLLVGQYTQFKKADRRDFLDAIAVETFARLLRAELPSPRNLGNVLGPAARQGRLQMATINDDENAFLKTVFLLGDLPKPDGNDHLAVVHSNGSNNKLDGFLHRRVSYQAEVDPVDGVIVATVTVDLENRVEPEGLPAYVIGSPKSDVPPGTNRVHLSIYTPHALEEIRIDGVQVDAELQQEFGYARYLVFADVPPGETVTVEYDLSGRLDLVDGNYRLTVAPQAVANPDHLNLDIQVGSEKLIVRQTIVEDTVFAVG